VLAELGAEVSVGDPAEWEDAGPQGTP